MTTTGTNICPATWPTHGKHKFENGTCSCGKHWFDVPCTAKHRKGRHEIYINAGPGGKRDPKAGWMCCQACGANGPDPYAHQCNDGACCHYER